MTDLTDREWAVFGTVEDEMLDMGMRDHGAETWEQALTLLSRVNGRIVEEGMFPVRHPVEMFHIMRRGHTRIYEGYKKFFRKLPVVPLDVFRKT
jgi:hypothetical protein